MDRSKRNAFAEHLSGRGRAIGQAIRHPVRFVGNRFREIGGNVRDGFQNVGDFFQGLFGSDGYTPTGAPMASFGGSRPSSPGSSWEQSGSLPQMPWEAPAVDPTGGGLYGQGQGMGRAQSRPSRGTGSLGQHASVLTGDAAVDFARSLVQANSGLNATSAGNQRLNQYGRRIAK